MKYPILFLALGIGASAFAGEAVVVGTCYEFPDVKEQNIVNTRGDQTNLRNDERYQLEYAYRTRESLRQWWQAGDPKEKPSLDEYDRVRNDIQRFQGDTVASVKNQAVAFLRSREAHRCEKSRDRKE